MGFFLSFWAEAHKYQNYNGRTLETFKLMCNECNFWNNPEKLQYSNFYNCTGIKKYSLANLPSFSTEFWSFFLH